MNIESIDFVITWVDGEDPTWIAEKTKYVSKEQANREDIAGESRYKDNGLLRYWFRGVEQFAPWVNKVFFVTYGHLPIWLNTANPKLRIVKHEDFLPKEYIPTFNSNTITLNLHRIKELSDRFVYFNDDMFLVSHVEPQIFFKNGLPREMAVLDIVPYVQISDYWYMYHNNIALLNRNCKKREMQNKYLLIWLSPRYGKFIIKNLLLMPFSLYSGFYEVHTPNSYLKSAYKKAWEDNFDQFNQTSLHKVRTYSDVTEWCIRYLQMVHGSIMPINKYKIGRYATIKSKSLPEMIKSGKFKYICINDECDGEQFEKVRSAFEHILPHKSSYERW